MAMSTTMEAVLMNHHSGMTTARQDGTEIVVDLRPAAARRRPAAARRRPDAARRRPAVARRRPAVVATRPQGVPAIRRHTVQGTRQSHRRDVQGHGPGRHLEGGGAIHPHHVGSTVSAMCMEQALGEDSPDRQGVLMTTGVEIGGTAPGRMWPRATTELANRSGSGRHFHGHRLAVGGLTNDTAKIKRTATRTTTMPKAADDPATGMILIPTRKKCKVGPQTDSPATTSKQRRRSRRQ